MQGLNGKYSFRLVYSKELDLLSTWLEEPMVARWYADPDTIDEMEESLNDSRIRMQLVLYDDVPIVYVQDYDTHQWDDHHLAFLPSNSRGIDTYIGPSELIGKGHGTNYISLLCAELLAAAVRALGIDPHPDNFSARRAYETVGFNEHGVVNSEWGRVLLMSKENPGMLNESRQI